MLNPYSSPYSNPYRSPVKEPLNPILTVKAPKTSVSRDANVATVGPKDPAI